MRLYKSGALAALILLISLPAHAGEGCSHDTQACLDYMATQMKNSGWVGVELEEGESLGPMTITKVIPDSPAEEAGIQPGDVLIAIGGVELSENNKEQLKAAKASWKAGSHVTWKMKRGSAPRELTITLAPMPADILARYVGEHMLEHAQVEFASSDKAPEHP